MFHSPTPTPSTTIPTNPSQELKQSSKPSSLPVSQSPQGTDEKDSKNSFSFSVRISRSPDPNFAHLAVVEPLIRFHTQSAQSAEAKKKNAVVFLVDNSASMAGLNFKAVQDALKDILHGNLNGDDYFEVITFGESAQEVKGLRGKKSTLDSTTFNTIIDSLKADGSGTQFAPPFDLVEPSRIPEEYDLTIVFLTDGNESRVIDSPDKILERMNKKFQACGQPKPKVSSIGIGGGSKTEITKKFDQPQDQSLSLYASDSQGIKDQFGQALKVMRKRYLPVQWALELEQQQGFVRSKDLGTIEEGGSLVGAAFTIPKTELQHAGKLRCGFKVADEEFAGEFDLASFDLDQIPYDVSATCRYFLQDAARIQGLSASPVRKIIMLNRLKKEAKKIETVIGDSKEYRDFLDVVNQHIQLLEKTKNSSDRIDAIQNEMNILTKNTGTIARYLQLLGEQRMLRDAPPSTAIELKKENTQSYFTDFQAKKKYRVIPAESYLIAFEDDLVALMEEKSPVAFSHTLLRGSHETEVLVLNDLNDKILPQCFSTGNLASLEDIVAAVQSLETVKTSALVREKQATLSLAECVKNKKGDAFVKALLCGILLTKKLKRNNPAFPEGTVRVYMDQDDLFQGTHFWCTYKTKTDHHIYLLDATNDKSHCVADLTLEESRKEMASHYAKRGLSGVLRGILDLFNYAHLDLEFHGFSPELCAAASEGAVPDIYTCPISQELMCDPVYVEQKKQVEGGEEQKVPAYEVWRSHAYQSDNIKKWFNGGHNNNPMTNLPTSGKCIPAEDLRPKLKRFLAKSYVPKEGAVDELKMTPYLPAKTRSNKKTLDEDKLATQVKPYFMSSSQAKQVKISVTGLTMSSSSAPLLESLPNTRPRRSILGSVLNNSIPSNVIPLAMPAVQTEEPRTSPIGDAKEASQGNLSTTTRDGGSNVSSPTPSNVTPSTTLVVQREEHHDGTPSSIRDSKIASQQTTGAMPTGRDSDSNVSSTPSNVIPSTTGELAQEKVALNTAIRSIGNARVQAQFITVRDKLCALGTDNELLAIAALWETRTLIENSQVLGNYTCYRIFIERSISKKPSPLWKAVGALMFAAGIALSVLCGLSAASGVGFGAALGFGCGAATAFSLSATFFAKGYDSGIGGAMRSATDYLQRVKKPGP